MKTEEKFKEIEKLDAKQAKEIADSVYEYELNKILLEIKANAEQGEVDLYIYDSIKIKTRDILRAKGFKISYNPSNNKDYYCISWG